MKEYVLTVFDKSGEKLLDERFQADNDDSARGMAQEMVKEHNYEEHAHRCVSPTAKLVLFHR